MPRKFHQSKKAMDDVEEENDSLFDWNYEIDEEYDELWQVMHHPIKLKKECERRVEVFKLTITTI